MTPSTQGKEDERRLAFGVRRFGVRRSAFGVRRSAFGVRRSAHFGVRRCRAGSAFGVRRSGGVRGVETKNGLFVKKAKKLLRRSAA